ALSIYANRWLFWPPVRVLAMIAPALGLWMGGLVGWMRGQTVSVAEPTRQAYESPPITLLIAVSAAMGWIEFLIYSYFAMSALMLDFDWTHQGRSSLAASIPLALSGVLKIYASHALLVRPTLGRKITLAQSALAALLLLALIALPFLLEM